MKKIEKKALAMLLIAGTLFFTGCGSKANDGILIGAMKGPTTIGLLSLIKEAEEGRKFPFRSYLPPYQERE